MAYSNLSVSLTPEQKQEIIARINAVKAALPFLINLNANERKSMRKVGDKRAGYINDVRNAVKANPNAIPPSIDVTEYDKDAQLFIDLSEIFEYLKPLFEGVSDTLMASGNEAIRTTDQSYAFLKAAARGGGNLDATIKDLAKHFAKTAKPKVA